MRPSRTSALISGFVPALAATLFVALPTTGQAHAAQSASDVAAVEPAWVTVTTDDAVLRCGDRTRYYAVAKLPKGAVLRIDAQSDEWARVVYPKAVRPFVRADDVSPEGDTHLRLATASGLLAPDEAKGIDYSWRSLYQPPLPAGTRLEIAETIKDSEGRVVAFRVVPPTTPPAYGYVQRSDLRPATPAEIARATKATPGSDAKATETKPAETRPAEPKPAAPPAGKPAASTSANTKPVDPKPTEPKPAETKPAETTPAEPAPGGTDAAPSTTQPRTATPARTDAVSEEVATLLELEAAFDDARKLPREQLDAKLDEMIEEYARVRTRLPDNAEGNLVRECVDERLAWLRLRAQTRDARLALTKAIDRATESSETLTKRLDAVRTTGDFAYVGRMSVSTVYDGRRLPRKLRLVSIDPLDAGRTIGYVREQDEAKAREFVGRVVGVRGRKRYDTASGLAVIEIDSVEPVEP